MIGRLFLDHPRSLGMGWAGHGSGAVLIGLRMIGVGLAGLVHAAVPALFTETAGRTVSSLHDYMTRRKADAPPPIPESNTPWEELFREKTGQMGEGAVLEFAVKYRGTSRTTPRHNH